MRLENNCIAMLRVFSLVSSRRKLRSDWLSKTPQAQRTLSGDTPPPHLLDARLSVMCLRLDSYLIKSETFFF